MPGDVLVIRGGVDSERMDVIDKHGGDGAPIVIRGEAGEHVFIDGPEPFDVSGLPAGFRAAGNSEWRRTAGNGIRRSANNIFVDVDPVSTDARYATTTKGSPLILSRQGARRGADSPRTCC